LLRDFGRWTAEITFRYQPASQEKHASKLHPMSVSACAILTGAGMSLTGRSSHHFSRW